MKNQKKRFVILDRNEKISFDYFYNYAKEIYEYDKKVKKEYKEIFLKNITIENLKYSDYLRFIIKNEDQNPIGFIFLSEINSPSLNIEHLYISPDFRRKNYATLAVDYISYIFKKPIVFGVLKKNNSAVRFWENYLLSCSASMHLPNASDSYINFYSFIKNIIKPPEL